MFKTRVDGDVIIEEIKLGDIHYEVDYGITLTVKVVTEPVLNDNTWYWVSENVQTGERVEYHINIKFPMYGPTLYQNKLK